MIIRNYEGFFTYSAVTLLIGASNE